MIAMKRVIMKTITITRPTRENEKQTIGCQNGRYKVKKTMFSQFRTDLK